MSSSEVIAAPTNDGIHHRSVNIPKPSVETKMKERNEVKERKKIPLLQTTLTAALCAGLTLLLAMFLLGFFQFGTWPNSTNLHALNTEEEYEKLAIVNATAHPFVIAFYSSSCMACRRMRNPFIVAAKQLNGIAQCFAAEASYKVNAKLLDMYNVTSVPSVYFMHMDKAVLYKGRSYPQNIANFVKGQMEYDGTGDGTDSNSAADSNPVDNGEGSS